MSLTTLEKIRAKQYAVNGATFMFIPHSSLCEKIIQDDPRTVGINSDLKIYILQGPIRLDPKMIIQYCDGTLSRNNTWLLDQGDIKVEPVKIKIEEKKHKKQN